MSAETLLLVLALAVAAYALLGRWVRSRRGALGIADGAIVSADDSIIRAPMLRSEHLELVGRCDHLLGVGDACVPVEHKPSARRLQQSHILQVGALCLLVQDVYGVRLPYGVVVLADGSQERITFSEELERGVVRAMAEMRRLLANGEPPGPRWVGGEVPGVRLPPGVLGRSRGPTRHRPLGRYRRLMHRSERAKNEVIGK